LLTCRITDAQEQVKASNSLSQGVPKLLPEIDPNIQNENSLSLAGGPFLYTADALGLSLDAQDKLVEIVDGKGLLRAGSRRRLKWPTVEGLVSDLYESRMQDGILGSNIAEEIRNKFKDGPAPRSGS
jgi:hypothetical protein